MTADPTQDSAETVERWDELRRMLDDTTLPWRVASQPNQGHAVDGRKWDILAGGPRYIALAVAAVNALPDLLTEVDRLSATQVTQALGTTGGLTGGPCVGCREDVGDCCHLVPTASDDVCRNRPSSYLGQLTCDLRRGHDGELHAEIERILADRLAARGAGDGLAGRVRALADEWAPAPDSGLVSITFGDDMPWHRGYQTMRHQAAAALRALVGDGGGAL